MKKDGLIGSIFEAAIAEEKKKYASKPVNFFVDQKKQLWYLLMNQVDGTNAPSGEKTEDAAAENQESTPQEVLSARNAMKGSDKK